MIDKNRLKREKEFHDQRFGGDDSERDNTIKYYATSLEMNDRFIEIIAGYCNNKKLLEYGCGTGKDSKKWIDLGAKLTGIDISSEGVKKATKIAQKNNSDAIYLVMDAEHTEFEDGSFDVVVGSGIIHHLNLKKSYQELARILKKDGHAVFSEPLGHNPIINLYRLLTPKMRTEDEHPLKISDIKLLEEYFHDVKIEYFSLFTLIAAPFHNRLFFARLCSLLRKIDKFLFLIPFIRRYAWLIIIDVSRPK